MDRRAAAAGPRGTCRVILHSVRTPLIVASTLVTAVLVGCGGTSLDGAKTEKLLADTVAAETGAKVKSVSCPADQKVEANVKFDCKVTGSDGSSAALPVTIVDDKGALKFRPVPFLKPAEVAEKIANALTEQVKDPVIVTCQQITVAKTDGKLTCNARVGKGENNKVFVTQTDTFGNVLYRVEG